MLWFGHVCLKHVCMHAAALATSILPKKQSFFVTSDRVFTTHPLGKGFPGEREPLQKGPWMHPCHRGALATRKG